MLLACRTGICNGELFQGKCSEFEVNLKSIQLLYMHNEEAVCLESARGRERQREADRDRERQGEAGRGRERQREAERGRERQKEAERGREKQRERERDTEKVR